MILFNILLGLLPTFVLAGSIAAGIDDDRAHRRMFVFVYGLWSLTLAMWNWMRSAHIAWIVLWAATGLIALVWLYATRSSHGGQAPPPVPPVRTGGGACPPSN